MASGAAAAPTRIDTGFSPTKKRLLQPLKRSGDRSLSEPSDDLGVSHDQIAFWVDDEVSEG